MLTSIYSNYSGNALRANLMILISSVVQLKKLDVEENLDHLRENNRAEVITCINDLQSCLQKIGQDVTSSKFRDISEKCLFQIGALLVKVVTMDAADDECVDTEVSEVLLETLESMKSVTNFQSQAEKKMLKQCQDAVSHPGGVDVELPPLNELWSLLRKLVLEASEYIEGPCECSCQLRRKVNGEIEAERLCKLSDLQEIMGKAIDESDSEREIEAVLEKCKRNMRRQQRSSDSSQEQSEDHVVKQTKNASVTSTPKKSRAISARGPSSRKRKQIPESSESMATIPESSESMATIPESSESEDESLNNTQKKYPTLPHVYPRWSLLNFGVSRKPPSHARTKLGKWLVNEEDAFIVKTLEIGEGKWAEIKTALMSARSSVQLKDKWRLISLSRIKKVARDHGLTYVGSKNTDKLV